MEVGGRRLLEILIPARSRAISVGILGSSLWYTAYLAEGAPCQTDPCRGLHPTNLSQVPPPWAQFESLFNSSETNGFRCSCARPSRSRGRTQRRTGPIERGAFRL